LSIRQLGFHFISAKMTVLARVRGANARLHTNQCLVLMAHKYNMAPTAILEKANPIVWTGNDVALSPTSEEYDCRNGTATASEARSRLDKGRLKFRHAITSSGPFLIASLKRL
jgi:hypothetical protein